MKHLPKPAHLPLSTVLRQVDAGLRSSTDSINTRAPPSRLQTDACKAPQPVCEGEGSAGANRGAESLDGRGT